MRKVTAKEACKIMRELGLDYGTDGTTFYAVNECNTEVYEFDSKKERDLFLEKHNKKH